MQSSDNARFSMTCRVKISTTLATSSEMDRVLEQSSLYDNHGLPLMADGNSHPVDENVDIEGFMAQIRAGNFSGLGLPPPSSLPTRAEVEKEARERSSEIFLQLKSLREILDRFEDVIRKRWLKKTKTQRTAIILRAWPNMSKEHRPDFQALFKGRKNVRSRINSPREAYLWPCMNVEDLARGKILLLFLNTRGRNPPKMFAHADWEATDVGRRTAAVMPAFLNVHTMLLDGNSVDTYGRLVSWDEDEEAMMNTIIGLTFQPGQGLWILEIQQRILKFLVDCSFAILHDINPVTATQAEIKPEPPSISDGSEFPTLATMALEAPYRLPALLDFTRISSIVAARRAEVEDYIQALREDPGFFADVLGEWSEHRQEKMLDTRGATHPVLGTPLFWERVIGNMILDAYGSAVVWDIISEQAAQLSLLQKQYSNFIKPHQALPKKYMKALLTFKYSLDQAAKGPIALLQTGYVASPPLRSEFVREPQVPGSTMIQVKSKSNGDERIRWLLGNLWKPEQLRLLGLPGIVDEIEHLTQKDPLEKVKISPWVARVFSDLGLIARVRHELDIYQPWAAGFEHGWNDHEKIIKKEFSVRFAAFEALDRNLKAVCRKSPLSKLGSPIGGRFVYPSDKRRTKESTEKMILAERNLDLFWSEFDASYKMISGDTVDQALQHIFKEKRHLDRTPEWMDTVANPKKELPGSSLPMSTLHLGSGSSLKFVAVPQKNKSKTRGTPQIGTDVDNSDYNDPVTVSEPQPTEDFQPRFKLKSRAFKVFKVLFYTPSQTDLPGEISWTDFLSAMASTGFAPEKLYGSVWQFVPSSLDTERSIQFHEPHPVGKIPFRNARRIGRRLARTYGWHGAMFSLD